MPRPPEGISEMTPPPIYGLPSGPGFVYRVLRDFGFPVLVSIALGWWIVRQDDITRHERLETIVIMQKMVDRLESIDTKLVACPIVIPAGKGK